jgi:subtilisin family serine protease
MANALDLVGLSALMRLSAGGGHRADRWTCRHGSRRLGGECDPRASAQSERRLLEGHEPRLPAWDVHGGHPSRQARLGGAGYLPQLRSAGVSDLRRHNKERPSATPEDLVAAVLTCIEAGARILNLSLALMQSFAKGRRALGEAFGYARKRRVIVVAAAGNQGSVGGAIITRHPGSFRVAVCDAQGDRTRVEPGTLVVASSSMPSACEVDRSLNL